MNSLIRYLLLPIVCILLAHTVAASVNAEQQPPEENTATFSLLTCGPGEAIYKLFGHTAIRYRDSKQGIDWVFNYGIFDFDSPNFIWRFVKGETDYKLGVTTFENFMREYEFYNQPVWEQILHLTDKETEILLNLLQTNYLPQNRVYRYNFFYNNCATRPRDMIEKCVEGELLYPELNNGLSFRNIIYQCTLKHHWSRFGMDFCLGPEADKTITLRQEMFSPLCLKDVFAKAHAVRGNDDQPLVSRQITLLKPEKQAQKEPFLCTPFRTFLLLFIFIAGLTIYGIKKKKSFWWVDSILFAAAGLAGCIIAFLAIFSEHPAVSPNYLMFAFHPFHLLLLPFFINKEMKKKKSIYHLINTVVLTLFILLWPIIPQHFNAAILPLVLSLLTRSASNLLLNYKTKK